MSRRAVMERSRTKYIAAVEPAELAVRLLEAAGGMKRPARMTAKETLAVTDADMRLVGLAMAEAALSYISECFRSASEPS